MKKQYLPALWAFAALSVAASLAQAQPFAGQGGPGHGPAMMGGGYGAHGPGPMAGAGPGMMAACNQDGHGPGMMGGMGGMGPYHLLQLSEAQQTQLATIHNDMRRKNWDTMGKLIDERIRMGELMAADKPDPAAVGRQSMKIAELRRMLLEARVDVHNRIEALLSKEQKEQLRSFRRKGMPGGGD